MDRIQETGKKLSKLKPQEKKGKLTARFKETEGPSYGMMKAMGYEYIGNKKGYDTYDKPKEGSPRVKLRPGQDASKYAPKGPGWESKQVGNKIIYTRGQTKTTEAPASSGSEMTAEQKENQMRGRQNPNSMQYRNSESPSTETSRERVVIKMAKDKSGDGGSSTTRSERQASRRALKVMCKGDSKSRGGCAIGPRRVSKAKY